jgi:hypothetical protein
MEVKTRDTVLLINIFSKKFSKCLEYIFRIYLNKVSLIIEERHEILNTTNGKLA